MIFFAGSAGYLLLYCLAFLVLVEVLSLIFAGRFIRINQYMESSRIPAGDSSGITFEVTNYGPLPYANMHLTFSEKDLFDDSGLADTFFSPKAKTEISASMTFEHRGHYRPGIKKISITGFLGLFRRTLIPPESDLIIAYPNGASVYTQFGGTRRTFSQRLFLAGKGEDSEEIADLRKYQPTDDHRKIHWKLSAAKGELIVKDFSKPETDSILVYLDTRLILKNTLRMEDAAASVAAAVFDAAFHENRSFDFLHCGTAEQVSFTPAQADEGLDLLAAIPFNCDIQRPSFIPPRRQGDYHHIIYISTHSDATLLDAVSFMRSSGCKVTLCSVFEDEPSRNFAAQTKAHKKSGVDIITFSATEIFKERNANDTFSKAL